MAEETKFTESEAHQHFARSLNNVVWNLLGESKSHPIEDLLLIHTAHASGRHWLEVGTPLHQQRAEWLIAKMYAQLGLAEAAVRHAVQCQQLAESFPELMTDFDMAYALEALARAHAVSGDQDAARQYHQQASAAGEAIQDEEDKQIFNGDFLSGNWGVLA